jgi:hypothetical protein
MLDIHNYAWLLKPVDAVQCRHAADVVIVSVSAPSSTCSLCMAQLQQVELTHNGVVRHLVGESLDYAVLAADWIFLFEHSVHLAMQMASTARRNRGEKGDPGTPAEFYLTMERFLALGGAGCGAIVFLDREQDAFIVRYISK